MSGKKQIRQQFRNQVFTRAKFCCETCGVKGYDRQESPAKDRVPLDAHHITDRHLFENGGYVKENGISVCDECHLKAEEFHSTGISAQGYSPEELYTIIRSNLEKAIKADAKLA